MRGLRAHHTPAHVLRAAQEGAAFVVRAGIDLLAETSGSGLPVVIAGGMSRSASVTQLRADVLGRPLLVYPYADASVRGAAALAGLASGMFGSLDDAVEALGGPAQRVDPDPRRHEDYEQVYRSWSGGVVP
jgi:sugar (pentulose or hexulose) kinase